MKRSYCTQDISPRSPLEIRARKERPMVAPEQFPTSNPPQNHAFHLLWQLPPDRGFVTLNT